MGAALLTVNVQNCRYIWREMPVSLVHVLVRRIVVDVVRPEEDADSKPESNVCFLCYCKLSDILIGYVPTRMIRAIYVDQCSHRDEIYKTSPEPRDRQY